MNQDILKRLKKFFSKEEHKILMGKPATDEQIRNAEKILNVNFDIQYVEFIKNFGGAYAGIVIFGFSNSEMLEQISVLELTERYRDSYNKQGICKEINDCYVISNDNGDPIMLDRQGKVVVYYHDSGDFEMLSRSFYELIDEYFED